MATDPLKQNLNRALEIKTAEQYRTGGIKLMDVDRAIMEHITDTVMPELQIREENIKVPLLYGSAERWKSIRVDGFLRDRAGQIQIPLAVIKRNSVETNDDLINPMNRQVSYPAVSQFSPKHKYDLFSKMTGVTRPKEQYNITIPDYVVINYEVVLWTDFTEHMNTLVEAFQFATDVYWGDKYGFKFLTKASSFDNTTEIGDGSQRIVKTTFTLEVKAYLLPEKFNNKPTTQKAFTIKKVLWSIDVDDEITTTESRFLTKTPTTGINYRDEYYKLIGSSSGSYDGGAANTW